jgi:hypothetical protein
MFTRLLYVCKVEGILLSSVGFTVWKAKCLHGLKFNVVRCRVQCLEV